MSEKAKKEIYKNSKIRLNLLKKRNAWNKLKNYKELRYRKIYLIRKKFSDIAFKFEAIEKRKILKFLKSLAKKRNKNKAAFEYLRLMRLAHLFLILKYNYLKNKNEKNCQEVSKDKATFSKNKKFESNFQFQNEKKDSLNKIYKGIKARIKNRYLNNHKESSFIDLMNDLNESNDYKENRIYNSNRKFLDSFSASKFQIHKLLARYQNIYFDANIEANNLDSRKKTKSIQMKFEENVFNQKEISADNQKRRLINIVSNLKILFKINVFQCLKLKNVSSKIHSLEDLFKAKLIFKYFNSWKINFLENWVVKEMQNYNSWKKAKIFFSFMNTFI